MSSTVDTSPGNPSVHEDGQGPGAAVSDLAGPFLRLQTRIPVRNAGRRLGWKSATGDAFAEDVDAAAAEVEGD